MPTRLAYKAAFGLTVMTGDFFHFYIPWSFKPKRAVWIWAPDHIWWLVYSLSESEFLKLKVLLFRQIVVQLFFRNHMITTGANCFIFLFREDKLGMLDLDVLLEAASTAKAFIWLLNFVFHFVQFVAYGTNKAWLVTIFVTIAENADLSLLLNGLLPLLKLCQALLGVSSLKHESLLAQGKLL